MLKREIEMDRGDQKSFSRVKRKWGAHLKVNMIGEGTPSNIQVFLPNNREVTRLYEKNDKELKTFGARMFNGTSVELNVQKNDTQNGCGWVLQS